METNTARDLDVPLSRIGFELEEVTVDKVNGRFKVTENCCQPPFNVLHGGVSALIAEALASMGAQVACGFQRVAGFQLNINHVKAVQLGDDVFAEATSICVSNTIQVWKVQLWKLHSSSSLSKTLISSSTVILMCNVPVPENAKKHTENLKMYAKL